MRLNQRMLTIALAGVLTGVILNPINLSTIKARNVGNIMSVKELKDVNMTVKTETSTRSLIPVDSIQLDDTNRDYFSKLNKTEDGKSYEIVDESNTTETFSIKGTDLQRAKVEYDGRVVLFDLVKEEQYADGNKTSAKGVKEGLVHNPYATVNVNERIGEVLSLYKNKGNGNYSYEGRNFAVLLNSIQEPDTYSLPFEVIKDPTLVVRIDLKIEEQKMRILERHVTLSSASREFRSKQVFIYENYSALATDFDNKW